jgi:hypothetical protein
MSNLTKSMLAFLLLFFIGTSISDAQIFRRRRSYSYSYSGSYGEYKPTKYSTEKRYKFDGKKLSLQDIAQLRAEAMAKHRVLTHGIHSIAKVPAAPIAEGIGVSGASNYKNVSTCIVGSIVVADGWCKSKSGSIYRVRFWR